MTTKNSLIPGWAIWLGCSFILLFECSSCTHTVVQDEKKHLGYSHQITAINKDEIEIGSDTLVIAHCQIIIGDGQNVISDGLVLIAHGVIQQVGTYEEGDVPKGARVLEAKGMTLVPGLIDAHFHLDHMDSLPHLCLQRGITALRDPGAWIEAYDQERSTKLNLPRLYLTGPHLDGYPPAHPKNAFVVRDEKEARAAVKTFVGQGASAIKVYYRSSIDIIDAICQAADEAGVPVTAHLEMTDIYDGVRAGLTGIEHITSLATNLVPLRTAEAYKQALLKDNNARRFGRYSLWQGIKPSAPKSIQLAQFLAEQQTYVCPTLGAFEYQVKINQVDSLRLEAFQHMMAYTKVLHDQGVNLVVGSHSWVPYAQYGWAYHHEMELLQQLGMKPLEILHAATAQNARFLGVSDQLGTIEKGKIADLVLIAGNPLEEIAALRKVHRVMLAGRWISPEYGVEYE